MPDAASPTHADWIELERIRRSGTVINQPLAAAVGWRA